jgi:hypothetical protein
MKGILASLAVVIILAGAGVSQHTQWASTQVTLDSAVVGRGINYTMNTHDIGEDVCVVFTLDPSSYNVKGDLEDHRITISKTTSGDIYVGREAAVGGGKFYAYVTFKWFHGACQ